MDTARFNDQHDKIGHFGDVQTMKKHTKNDIFPVVECLIF